MSVYVPSVSSSSKRAEVTTRQIRVCINPIFHTFWNNLNVFEKLKLVEMINECASVLPCIRYSYYYSIIYLSLNYFGFFILFLTILELYKIFKTKSSFYSVWLRNQYVYFIFSPKLIFRSDWFQNTKTNSIHTSFCQFSRFDNLLLNRWRR